MTSIQKDSSRDSVCKIAHEYTTVVLFELLKHILNSLDCPFRELPFLLHSKEKKKRRMSYYIQRCEKYVEIGL
jgi:hypothetical protein